MVVREPRERGGRELRRGDPVRLTWTIEDGLLLADGETTVAAATSPGDTAAADTARP